MDYTTMYQKNEHYETLWSDMNIEAMNTDMGNFQAKIKKLPKAIKD